MPVIQSLWGWFTSAAQGLGNSVWSDTLVASYNYINQIIAAPK